MVKQQTGNSNKCGRPKIEITETILLDLYKKYNDWYKVASVLGVSHMTVYRRLTELGIRRYGLYRTV